MAARSSSSVSGSGSGSGGDVENVVLSEKELLKKEEVVVGPVKTLDSAVVKNTTSIGDLTSTSSSSSALALKATHINMRPNFFNTLLFTVASPMVSTGYRRRLEEEDLLQLEDQKVDRVFGRFDKDWELERAAHATAAAAATSASSTTPKQPSLFKALFRKHMPMIVTTGGMYAVSQLLMLAGPFFLKRIVNAITCEQTITPPDEEPLDCPSRETMYYYCIGLLIAPMTSTLLENHTRWMLTKVGVELRTAVMAAMYRKVLNLSSMELQSESTGKIVTLMSVDANRLQMIIAQIHQVWASPMYIIAIMIMLWFEISWSALIGLLGMFLLVPFTGQAAGKLAKLKREIVAFTDKRVQKVTEALGGARVVKFYSWERAVLRAVDSIRSEEVGILRRIAIVQAFFSLFMFSAPMVVGLFSFGSYVLAGSGLTAEKAYTSLALFTLLRMPLAFLPFVIAQMIELRVSMRRISKFLLLDEQPPLESSSADEDAVVPVSIKGGKYRWGFKELVEPAPVRRGGPGGGPPPEKKKSAKEDAKDEAKKEEAKPNETGKDSSDEKKEKEVFLRDIDVVCTPGTLTCVVGPVGSGKTSLLAALVGQMPQLEGKREGPTRAAYVSQTPWILNATVRQNIVLGGEFDQKRYDYAVDVAQLRTDLALLTHGDNTEIGERGVTLSGGQKARVSMARAVYADAPLVIMDDPLAALDAHVGAALLQECILGDAMKDKVKVLVTHNTEMVLPHADQVIVMADANASECRIRAAGTLEELRSQGIELNSNEFAGAPLEESDEEASAEKKGDKTDEKASEGKKDEGEKASDLPPDVAKNLTGVESREKGAVSMRVFGAYLSAAGGVPTVGLIALLYSMHEFARAFADRWLGLWAEDVYKQSTGFYLGMYMSLLVSFAAILFIRALCFTLAGVRATTLLHNNMIAYVMQLKVAFFDCTPSGRVINRFSKDVDTIDSSLPLTMIQLIGCLAAIGTSFVVITVITPFFVVALLPIVMMYAMLQRFYIPTSREVQRIESVTRSPIYAGFSETVTGASVIRAFGRIEHFIKDSDKKIYINNCALVTQQLASAWLAVRLDILGAGIVGTASFLAVQGHVDAALAGLSITYALEITRFLKGATAMFSQVETQFNAVERVVEYSEKGISYQSQMESENMKWLMSPEAAAETDEDSKIAASWPKAGAISINALELRYRPWLPLVLRGVSFEVASGEKAGICGRTGAGKSTVFLALYRLVEPTGGSICIDGVDISKLGLQRLRTSLAMVPQDAYMFSGSLRGNLDPFDDYTDAELWEAIDQVGLKQIITDLPGGLETNVADNGDNFSHGQRQLMCMCRALLRKASILMLDEATASVDHEGDMAIQKAVREAFRGKTVLTIAHRLHTIAEGDKIVVIDDGVVAEIGSPSELKDMDDGLFSSLLRKATSSGNLWAIAASEEEASGVPKQS